MRTQISSLILLIIICFFPKTNRGQTIIASDSLALIAFYEATNGPNWRESWDINLPISYWQGVMYENGRVKGIRLTSNQLQGSIPESVGNLSELEILDLGNNRLYGAFPYSLTNLNNLTTLQIGSNSFSGNIPSGLANLRNLKYLVLSNNQFNGNIPPELGSMPNLEILNISNNQLYGLIPDELGNLPNLKMFSASHNQLEGTIPDSFLNYRGKRVVIDLSNNLIEPTILEKWNQIFLKQ